MAKNALGRGLDSLLGGSYESSNSTSPTKRNKQTEQTPTNTNTAAFSKEQKQRVDEPYVLPTNNEHPKERISMGRINASTGEITNNPAHFEKVAATVKPESENTQNNALPEKREQAFSSESTARNAAITNKKQMLGQTSSQIPPQTLLLEHIEPNTSQPRINFKKDELEELAASIKKDGLLQPILVRAKGEKYEIIAGERRYRASKIAGLHEVPVIIKEADDEEALEFALIENIQRSDLNPIEEAYAYRRLMDKKKLNQAQVAQIVSKGRSTVANALRLLDLPEDAQQLLYEEKISAGHARAILSIPSAQGREKLTEKLLESKLSVREAESYARLLSLDHKKNEEPKQSPTPKTYKKVARGLHDYLDTTVKIKTSQGRNRIEIEFKDENDLQRLFTILVEQES